MTSVWVPPTRMAIPLRMAVITADSGKGSFGFLLCLAALVTSASMA